jgi:hypothetical protein
MVSEMIRLMLFIKDGKVDLTMEGEGSKTELLACIGIMEDLKHKILSSTQDDGEAIVFSMKRGKDGKIQD